MKNRIQKFEVKILSFFLSIHFILENDLQTVAEFILKKVTCFGISRVLVRQNFN
jgi:hypothetical protein